MHHFRLPPISKVEAPPHETTKLRFKALCYFVQNNKFTIFAVKQDSWAICKIYQRENSMAQWALAPS